METELNKADRCLSAARNAVTKLHLAFDPEDYCGDERMDECAKRALDDMTLVAAELLGLLAAAVLAVNNHRDRAGDRIAGRRTLALRLGSQATCGVYTLLVLGPFLLAPTLHLHGLGPWSWLLPELALPWALRLAVRFWRTGGTGLNAVLVATVRLELYFGLLLTLGVVLDHHTPP